MKVVISLLIMLLAEFTDVYRITDGEPGLSVLLNFDSLFQIERYIEEAYQLSGRVYPPCFQVQFISVIVDTDELTIIQLSQISYLRNMKIQQKLTKNLQQEKQGRKKQEKFLYGKNACQFRSSPRHAEL